MSPWRTPQGQWRAYVMQQLGTSFPALPSAPAEAPPTAPPGGYAPAAPAGAPEVSPLGKIKWKEGEFTLGDARAPDWWKPFIPKKAKDMERPDVAFLAMLNASIPYLSPEDQLSAAAQLYAISGNAFSAYKQETLKPHEKKVISQSTAMLSEAYKRDPGKYTVMTPELRRYYQSQERAAGFIEQLSQLREQTIGQRDRIAGTGIPYTWLQQVAGTSQRLGGAMGAGQTRADYMQMLGALDPLLAQGKSAEVGGALAIGQMFARPFFSPRPLWPRRQVYGTTRFGMPNPILFG